MTASACRRCSGCSDRPRSPTDVELVEGGTAGLLLLPPPRRRRPRDHHRRDRHRRARRARWCGSAATTGRARSSWLTPHDVGLRRPARRGAAEWRLAGAARAAWRPAGLDRARDRAECADRGSRTRSARGRGRGRARRLAHGAARGRSGRGMKGSRQSGGVPDQAPTLAARLQELACAERSAQSSVRRRAGFLARVQVQGCADRNVGPSPAARTAPRSVTGCCCMSASRFRASTRTRRTPRSRRSER